MSQTDIPLAENPASQLLTLDVSPPDNGSDGSGTDVPVEEDTDATANAKSELGSATEAGKEATKPEPRSAAEAQKEAQKVLNDLGPPPDGGAYAWIMVAACFFTQAVGINGGSPAALSFAKLTSVFLLPSLRSDTKCVTRVEAVCGVHD